MSHRIFETENFIEEVGKLSRNFKGLEEKLLTYVYPQLKENPYFGKNIKKLRSYTPDTWRYRIGKLRIFYEIDGDDLIIIMITASQRKDSY